MSSGRFEVPIYDFKCRQCGKVLEILIRILEKSEVVCPGCGSRDMDMTISSSYLIKKAGRSSRTTCCGRDERCEKPPCSTTLYDRKNPLLRSLV